MLADLAAVDVTLRLFNPEIRLAKIKPKPFPPGRGCNTPGMRVRDVLGTLRETGRTMTTQRSPSGCWAAVAVTDRSCQGWGDRRGIVAQAAGEGRGDRRPWAGKQMEWRLAEPARHDGEAGRAV